VISAKIQPNQNPDSSAHRRTDLPLLSLFSCPSGSRKIGHRTDMVVLLCRGVNKIFFLEQEASARLVTVIAVILSIADSPAVI
jgi:hypothetical protein